MCNIPRLTSLFHMRNIHFEGWATICCVHADMDRLTWRNARRKNPGHVECLRLSEFGGRRPPGNPSAPAVTADPSPKTSPGVSHAPGRWCRVSLAPPVQYVWRDTQLFCPVCVSISRAGRVPVAVAKHRTQRSPCVFSPDLPKQTN